MTREQIVRHRVDPAIRGLCGQNRGHQQLERCGEIKLAPGFGILRSEPGIHLGCLTGVPVGQLNLDYQLNLDGCVEGEHADAHCAAHVGTIFLSEDLREEL